MPTRYALAVHGGAGRYGADQHGPAERAAYHAGLRAALLAGQGVLERGGAALDAVEAAVRSLEECVQFNAGHGAVLTHAGTVELDAAIMRGSDLAAGAVAALRTTRNPVRLARALLERGTQLLVHGAEADGLAASLGLEQVANDWFIIPERRRQLAAAQASAEAMNISKYGTVGAVACDRAGRVAAATSTGGMTNKQWGRIGDSPVIGAGTYADDRACAVSATGHGEYFIRATVARTVAALMEYGGRDLAGAVDAVMHERLGPMGGEGGLIAVDPRGTIVFGLNVAGMFRGSVREGGVPVTAILAGEPDGSGPA